MGRKNMLRKEFLMELRKSWPRFVSIAVMVFLGVAFFSGIRAASPDMKKSADAFYDGDALMDIRVMSDLGLTEDDLAAVSQVDGVQSAEGGYAADLLWNTPEDSYAVRFMSAAEDLDQITVKEGRMPETGGECLIDEKLADQTGYGVGDVMTISSGTEDDLSDTMARDTFTIVGVGVSPYYLSLDRGTCSIGTGQRAGFAVVLPEDFSLEVYTQILLSVEGSAELLCYSDAYDDLVDEVQDNVEAIADARCEIRYEEVQGEAADKIADAEDEIADAKKKLADAEDDLADAEEKLADGKEEIEENEKKLADSREELAASKKKIESGKKQIAQGKKELKKGKKKLKKAKASLAEGQKSYQEGKAAYDSGVKQLAAAKEQLAGLKKQAAAAGGGDAQLKGTIAAMDAQITQTEATLAATKAQLAAAKKKLDKGKKEYRQGRKEYKENKKLLAAKEKELKDGEKQIAEGEKQLAEAEEQLADAKKKLAKSERKLKKAKKKFEKKKKKAEKKIAKGEKKIADAKEDLADLEVPEWYVLDRNTIETYVEYGQNAEKIEAIGKVFPAIFFLVAALVCLTTMTRMVQDDRTQIGVLKALGYPERKIVRKYISYAFFSTLLGSVAGILFGQKAIPWLIINAYGIMYNNLPEILLPYHAFYSLVSVAAAMFCTVFAAYAACRAALRATPAALMRPEAPKAGKRIFLEYIPFIWKHFNFSQKAAVRNLLRYKKRFLMTVFGIGGCMGILIVGFGIKDSLLVLGDRQFGQIRKYDASIGIENDVTEEERAALMEKITADDDFTASLEVKETSVDASANGEEKSAYVVVPKEKERLTDFVTLQERTTGKACSLDGDGVIITEKLGKLLDVKVGDEITLEEEDQETVSVRVDGIVENYYYHYIFMDASVYEKLYGETPEYETVYLMEKDSSEEAEDAVRKEYLDVPGVSGVSFIHEISERVDSMLKSMDTLIWVIVTAAGLLAFVVLYNLNNINISERQRELATLKVLGFYDGEVSQYILRENVILTILGSAAGVVIGFFLHRFIMVTAEVEMMMFGRQVSAKSYLYSFLLTLLFAAVINFFMHFKMKKIDMIESLKSVE